MPTVWGVVKRRSVRLGVAQLACLLGQVASKSGAVTLPAAPRPYLDSGQVRVLSQYQGPNGCGAPEELEQAPTGDDETSLFSPGDYQLIADAAHRRAPHPTSVLSPPLPTQSPPPTS